MLCCSELDHLILATALLGRSFSGPREPTFTCPINSVSRMSLEEPDGQAHPTKPWLDALALRRELGLPIREPIVMPPEGLLEYTRPEESAVPADETPAPSLPGFSARFSKLQARVRKLIGRVSKY